jgi:hypothetical protein
MPWRDDEDEDEDEDDLANYVDDMDECDEDEQAIVTGDSEIEKEDDYVSNLVGGSLSPPIDIPVVRTTPCLGAAGDIPGLPVGHDVNIFITQPAVDDVQTDSGMFMAEDVAAALHGANWLGDVHASSGIRRLRKDGATHEIDWALVEIRGNRLPSGNTVRGGAKFCEPAATGEDGTGEDVHPGFIVPADQLAGKKVHASGRTSGLQSGTICSAMGAVMLPGRDSFAESWCVIGKLGGKQRTRPSSSSWNGC